MSKNILGLYKHNQDSYKKVKASYDSGEKVVGIIHATGTGKTFNALQLAYDNPDKQIIYVTPYNSIIEHIQELIKENPELDYERDFKHVKFMTYAGLSKLSPEELENLNVDMMILDEFHHIGAPVWGDAVNKVISSHEDLLIFGMSAYSIRDRGTQYERDMAEDNGNELFSDKIVSRYDLGDAILDGVLPVPIYKSAYINLLDYVEKIEKKATKKYNGTPRLTEYLKVLNDVKRKIISNLDSKKLLLNNIKKNGKYIYFCPMISVNSVNDIHTIMNEMKEFLLNNGYSESDIEFYYTTGDEEVIGKKNRKAFYNDVDLDGNDTSNKLRIMFAINQYNEGVHAPNVDGVILGRETSSDIVYFEQIGRGLSVRGNTYLKIEELKEFDEVIIKELCITRGIKIEGLTKDDMIERLVAPTIIDLAGNIAFIKDLITDLKHRIRERQIKGNHADRILNITDNSFDIDILGQDLIDVLNNMNREFLPQSWEDSYKLAVNYFNTYGNLNISRKFKTEDGIIYDEYGYPLGEWLAVQKREYTYGKLSFEQIDKLEKINIVWKVVKTWDEAYLLAKKYYEVHKNLLINYEFKTIDGYTYNKNGYGLGSWLVNQRRLYRLGKLSKDRIKLLEDIGVVWNIIKSFEESYKLCLEYYNIHGTINMPKDYILEDGYNLGGFVYNQKLLKRDGKLSSDRIKLFEDLGIDWTIKEVKKNPSWDEMYKLASNYFNTYGDLEVKRSFITKDGITKDTEGYNLGRWISRQRVSYKNNKLTNDQIKKLEEIGMKWNLEASYKSWDESYQLALEYFIENGNLNVKSDYITKCGYNLGAWIYLQRKNLIKDKLTQEQIDKLNLIGMIWNVSDNYSRIKEILRSNGINYRKYMSYLKQYSVIEIEAKIKYLLDKGYAIIENTSLHEIFNMSDINMKVKYGVTREDLIRNYLGIDKKV